MTTTPETTKPDAAAPDLFTPVALGALTLPSRIVMAPMTRSRAGDGNVPRALNAEYYRQRAGAGLIVTEATQISPQGVGYPATPGIHSAVQVEGWKAVTEAVHDAGGRIFLQLWHVGRISHSAYQPERALPVAPSAIAPEGEKFTPEGSKPYEVPRALRTEEIPGIVEDYRTAAENARAAGFDGVEIHAANGYLIDQFLRDGTNKRTDRYGGSLENRTRFLIEVTEAVTGVWGGDRVGVRLSPAGSFNSMSDSAPNTTFRYAIEALNRFGLAYLHVVEDNTSGGADWALLRAAFKGPYMANGGYHRARATAALASGAADLVSFGSSYLANPDLPERIRLDAPLNAPNPGTFYGGEAGGYTDYPALDAADAQSAA